MKRYRRILAPLDGSHLSKMAFDQAVSLASMIEGEVHVLHVIEHPALEPVTINGQEVMSAMELIQTETVEQARNMMNDMIGSVEHPGVKVTTEITDGPVAREIIESSSNFDLVIMGTQGRNMLTSLLLGGVAEKVVRHAHCPVMLVREKMDE